MSTEEMKENTAGTAEQEPAPEAEPEKVKKTAKKASKKDALADAEIARLKEELAEAKDQQLRTFAEFDNFRKRSQKEKDLAFGDGVMHAAKQLLPVIDSFDMAMAYADGDAEGFRKGVELIYQKLGEYLTNVGISEIPAKDLPFDADLHNAVMTREDPDVEENTVLDVMQKGYTMGDRVLRHSMVVVSVK